jgi:2-amino-4-hydroxy-6-hydroxymethyldihydropteridine diphosphokinase
MVDAYVSIGSNIDAQKNIQECVNLIESDLKIASKSSYYKTRPFGFEEQGNFINLVVKIVTDLKPHELLKKLQTIEKKLGRERIIKDGPRTIDLDILLYGSEVINDKDLVVPHKGLLERDFMLIPLLDISPDVEDPRTKEKLKDLKTSIKYHQILGRI